MHQYVKKKTQNCLILKKNQTFNKFLKYVEKKHYINIMIQQLKIITTFHFTERLGRVGLTNVNHAGIHFM